MITSQQAIGAPLMPARLRYVRLGIAFIVSLVLTLPMTKPVLADQIIYLPSQQPECTVEKYELEKVVRAATGFFVRNGQHVEYADDDADTQAAQWSTFHREWYLPPQPLSAASEAPIPEGFERANTATQGSGDTVSRAHGTMMIRGDLQSEAFVATRLVPPGTRHGYARTSAGITATLQVTQGVPGSVFLGVSADKVTRRAEGDGDGYAYFRGEGYTQDYHIEVDEDGVSTSGTPSADPVLSILDNPGNVDLQFSVLTAGDSAITPDSTATGLAYESEGTIGYSFVVVLPCQAPAFLAYVAEDNTVSLSWYTPCWYNEEFILTHQYIYRAPAPGMPFEQIWESDMCNLIQLPLVTAAQTVSTTNPYRQDYYVDTTGSAHARYILEIENPDRSSSVYGPLEPFSARFVSSTLAMDEPLTLLAFDATLDDEEVALTWDTAREAGVVGYRLYRSTAISGTQMLVTATDIPAQGDANSGGDYTFTDMPGSGRYYYHLAAIDDSDVATMIAVKSAGISTTPVPDTMPVANAGGPYRAELHQLVHFDASGSFDPNGEIEVYQWDFDNDGLYDANILGPTASHTYHAPYTGLLTLRVTDNDGEMAIATAQVQVPPDGSPVDATKMYIPLLADE